jgi:hypothetical protein
LPQRNSGTHLIVQKPYDKGAHRHEMGYLRELADALRRSEIRACAEQGTFREVLIDRI